MYVSSIVNKDYTTLESYYDRFTTESWRTYQIN